MTLIQLKKEIVGGITQFFTVLYCLAIVPLSLSQVGLGISFEGAFTGTILLIVVSSLIMGLFARSPFIIAPSMGAHIFFIHQVILKKQLSAEVGFGILFWAGILLTFFFATPWAKKLYHTIPHHLKLAATFGIGLFLIIIGFQTAGVTSLHPEGWFHLSTAFVVFHLAILGTLLKLKNPFAFLFGVLGTTLLGIFCGDIFLPASKCSQPDFQSVLFRLNIVDSFRFSYFPAIFFIALTAFLEVTSTLNAISVASGRKDESGEPLHFREGMISAGFSNILSGLFGSTPTTVYLESLTGIQAGAKTGLAAVIAALCFLPCLFLSPWVKIVPAYASSPILVVIGCMILKETKQVRFVFRRVEDAIPALATIFIIPFTFSVTQGVLVGLALHCLLYALVGRRKEISLPFFCFSFGSLIFLLLDTWL